MKVITLSHPTKKIKGTIVLPASKSISNRVLILKHVLGSTTELQNISEADDTVLMQMALAKGNGTIHLKNAGTCMRFLTAYFAATENSEVTLLCDERMEKRPIDELVTALQQLGAEITYLNKQGYPPLQIKGKQLNGGHVSISAQASSQYVSALMMIAPLCKTDLTIELTGEITSAPYIDMTVKLMQEFGINIVQENSKFEIRNSKTPVRLSSSKPFPEDIVSRDASMNSAGQYTIEGDWSAASYWYEMVALSDDAEVFLPNLSLNSLQGDSLIAEYMKQFGVETIIVDNGILLKNNGKRKTENGKQKTDLDLTDTPDLAPTLAVTAAAKNTQLTLTGLQNLIIKESNRLQALETELSKLGVDIISTEDSLSINLQTSNIKPQTSNIATYGDHRMAMAFAPLALLFETITIEHPEVVEKSYPHFWDDLTRMGFILSDTKLIQ